MKVREFKGSDKQLVRKTGRGRAPSPETMLLREAVKTAAMTGKRQELFDIPEEDIDKYILRLRNYAAKDGWTETHRISVFRTTTGNPVIVATPHNQVTEEPATVPAAEFTDATSTVAPKPRKRTSPR